jgi:hypothetical protein
MRIIEVWTSKVKASRINIFIIFPCTKRNARVAVVDSNRLILLHGHVPEIEVLQVDGKHSKSIYKRFDR